MPLRQISNNETITIKKKHRNIEILKIFNPPIYTFIPIFIIESNYPPGWNNIYPETFFNL